MRFAVGRAVTDSRGQDVLCGAEEFAEHRGSGPHGGGIKTQSRTELPGTAGLMEVVTQKLCAG